MANAWRTNNNNKAPKKITSKTLVLLFTLTFLLITLFFFTTNFPISPHFTPQFTHIHPKMTPFNCSNSPQHHPVIGNTVENLKHPFMFSLSDLGSLPEKPNKNMQRLLKKKPFRRPDISQTVQEVLGRVRAEGGGGRVGIVVDVGANVGMATFAAAVMGFRVFAFEPVFENLQRFCDGVYFNRVENLVTVFDAAASDHFGNITFHKLVGRLDNSAVSATGAKLAFKSNEEIAVQVKTIPLDDVIPESEPVLLLKIDVQGWEYHVLKGAKKLLSRKAPEAPYIIYEEDERLLQASNTTAKEIRDFLKTVGYNHCTQHGTDAHCTKNT
ncbi:hypothetical protein vseg_016428 [Gypsophila vaccaria]